MSPAVAGFVVLVTDYNLQSKKGTGLAQPVEKIEDSFSLLQSDDIQKWKPLEPVYVEEYLALLPAVSSFG